MSDHWKQGQHVGLIGRTGRGKTTLARYLLDIRDYVVVLGLKPNDKSLEEFRDDGYKVISRFPPHDERMHRVIYWIRPKSILAVAEQREKVAAFFDRVYKDGGWCVFIDEGGLVGGNLKLGAQLGILLNQGRSNHISMVVAMTRPSSVIAAIPKEAVTQISHVIVFKTIHRKELETVADIAGVNKEVVLECIQYMQPHDFLAMHDEEEIFLVRFTDKELE